MKNHKGTVAALLTLGLVVIGALITLGTSLFVSNSKTNLTSNSMAYTNPCNGPYTCPAGRTGDYYSRSGTMYADPGCYSASALSWDQICKPSGGSTNPPPTDGGVLPLCSSEGINEAKRDCGDGNFTNVGCRAGSNTYKCKSDIVPIQPPTGGGGDIGPGQSCCFAKKGLIYVYATYDSLVANEMVNDAGNPDCARQSAGVIRSYGADSRGAFTCSGSTQNQTPENPGVADTIPTGNSCGYEDECETGACVAIGPGTIRPHTGGTCKKYNPSVVTPWPTTPLSGGRNCTDADYTVLADPSCGGADGWCGPKQKKYKKSPNNTCVSTSVFKCKNDSSCTNLSYSCAEVDVRCTRGIKKGKTIAFWKANTAECQSNQDPDKCYNVGSGTNGCKALSWLEAEDKACQITNTSISNTDVENLRCRFVSCSSRSFNQGNNIYYYREYTSKYFVDEGSCMDVNNPGSTQDSVKKQVCNSANVELPVQNPSECVKYNTVNCSKRTSMIYHASTCTDKSYSCWGDSPDSCNERYSNVYAKLCPGSATGALDVAPIIAVPIIPDKALILPPTFDTNAMGTGAIIPINVQNPSELNCKPIPNDLTCSNYNNGMNIYYYAKIEYDSKGRPKVPTHCCPLQIPIQFPGL